MTRMLCCVTPINRQTSRDHTLPDNLLLETNTSYTSRGHALLIICCLKQIHRLQSTSTSRIRTLPTTLI